MQQPGAPPEGAASGGPEPSEIVARNLAAASAAIDATFGAGHAAANPALVAAYLQACAIEAAVAAGRDATREALETLARLSRETNATLLKLKPRLFG